MQVAWLMRLHKCHTALCATHCIQFVKGRETNSPDRPVEFASKVGPQVECDESLRQWQASIALQLAADLTG